MNLYCKLARAREHHAHGEDVVINIVDLDAFIHAAPPASIAVADLNGDQFFVEKRDLRDFSFFKKGE